LNARIGETELQALCEIAQKAGIEIMDVYASRIDSWSKGDGSPLTEADLRADRVIQQGLAHAFPDVGVMSEESASTVSADATQFFLVDPLDGTKEFIARNGEFTVNIALIQDGEAQAGVVFAPALDELFFAARGLGAWKSQDGKTRRIQVMPRRAPAPLRVVGSRSHGLDETAAWLARLDCQYEVQPAGSSLKFCRIAEGQADLYPRFGPTSQWDTAAGHAVLKEAGGVVYEAPGRELLYGISRPILNPAFVALADPALAIPPMG
jgi:3'(2'),5'-bisphosphate nucleotidase